MVKSAMRILARIGFMIIPVQGLEIEQTRKRAAEDAERDDNVTHEATCFDSERECPQK